MGMVARVLNRGREKRALAQVGLTSEQLAAWMVSPSTLAGVYVSPETAMMSTAVLAAVGILAGSVASLPLMVYRRNGRTKELAPDHALYPVLHDRANPEMTAFRLRRWQMRQMALMGNALCEIEWSNGGQVKALWPLDWHRVGVERDVPSGQLRYTYWSDRFEDRQPGGVVLPAWRVLHVRWHEADSVIGYSPIRLAAGPVAMSLAMEQYGAKYFEQGARPSIILKHPGVLSENAYQRLRASFQDRWEGLENSHRVQIIEEGMQVETVGVPPQEAQLLEARKFQLQEIARMFRVPVHLIGDTERATFNNIEHLSREFMTFTLGEILQNIEQEIRLQLMTPEELQAYDVEHLVDGFLRGDSQTRWATHVQAVTNGLMSLNEARAIENLNPIPGGDQYYMPLNLAPVGSVTSRPELGTGGEGPAAAAPVAEDKVDTGNQGDQADLGAPTGPTGEPLGKPGEAEPLKPGQMGRAAAEGCTCSSSGSGGCTCGQGEGRRAQGETDVAQAAPAGAVMGASEADDRLMGQRQRLLGSYVPAYRDAAARVVRREVNDIRRAAAKYLGGARGEGRGARGDASVMAEPGAVSASGVAPAGAQEFAAWLEEFYAKLRQDMPDLFRGLMETYGRQVALAVGHEVQAPDDAELTAGLADFIQRYLEAFAEGYTAGNRQQLLALLEDPEAAAAIEDRLSNWDQSEAQRTAQREANEAGNALAWLAYGAAGVTVLRWRARADACPFCRSLDGRKAGIEGYFVNRDGSVAADGQEMMVRRNTRHGPLHEGCDCVVLADR